jgi:DNA-directed RNA polymerase subunit F
VRPIIWSGVKALGRETLRTGGDILSDIAEAKPTTSLQAKNIVSKRLNESKQNLINKLSDAVENVKNLLLRISGNPIKKLK